MATIEQRVCPHCATTGTLHLAERLVAEPLGSFSLAGAMPKTTARFRPVLTCSACPLELVGDWHPDGRHVVFAPPEPAGA